MAIPFARNRANLLDMCEKKTKCPKKWLKPNKNQSQHQTPISIRIGMNKQNR